MAFVAVATIGSALIGADAASSAADSQAAASDRAVASQDRRYDQTRADQMPWMDAGKVALGKLSTGIDTPLDPKSVQMDPGYQFGLSQGQMGIDRKTAAAGGRISGAALKAAAQYNGDYATTRYDTAYNRVNQARSDRLNRLAALAGIGQTSAQQVGAAGVLTGQGNANTITAQGNATAAGQLAQGNIWGGAANQLAALYGRNSGGSQGAGWSPNAAFGSALGGSGVNGNDSLYG